MMHNTRWSKVAGGVWMWRYSSSAPLKAWLITAVINMNLDEIKSFHYVRCYWLCHVRREILLQRHASFSHFKKFIGHKLSFWIRFMERVLLAIYGLDEGSSMQWINIETGMKINTLQCYMEWQSQACIMCYPLIFEQEHILFVCPDNGFICTTRGYFG